jgi:HSP20 family protein
MWMVTTRRPENEVAAMQTRMNRLLSEMMGTWPYGAEGGAISSAWMPPVDVFEDKDGIKLVAELPGVKADDVKISLENYTLTLRGEKKQVAEETIEKVHRYERSYGSFERTFTLPSTVDSENIRASFEDGVLTVMLPKVEKAKPREIPVVSGGEK